MFIAVTHSELGYRLRVNVDHISEYYQIDHIDGGVRTLMFSVIPDSAPLPVKESADEIDRLILLARKKLI